MIAPCRIWPAAFALLLTHVLGAGAESLQGFFSIEHRSFPRKPLFPTQVRHFNTALTLEAGYVARPTPRLSLAWKGLVRLDENDPERTRFDFKELHLDLVKSTWRLDLGINEVFWGVTESRHLVDVVNQIDFAGDLEGEEKLGQPMARFAYMPASAGQFELFAMTGFRPRPLPGIRGRPGFPIPFGDEPDYESSLGPWQGDLALRWSHSLGGLDWALSAFYGTSREPQFQPAPSATGLILRPRHDLIRQAGSECQWTSGAWQWKLEALARQGQGPAFTAVTAGLEYLVANLPRGTEISPILEYSHDDRKNGTLNLFDHDAFTGMRIRLNNIADTWIQAGTLTDLDDWTVLGVLEGGHRIGDSWKVLIDGRFYSVRDGDESFLVDFRRDLSIQLELRRYY